MVASSVGGGEHRGVSVIPRRHLVARILNARTVVVFAVKDEPCGNTVKVRTGFN